VHVISTQFRAVENFIRHPKEILMQRGRRVAEDRITEIEIPFNQRSLNGNTDHANSEIARSKPIELSTNIQTYTLNSPTSSQLLTPQKTSTLLNQGDSLQGRKGRYQITKYLATSTRFNLYQGIQVSNHKTVLIKQYLLSERELNQSEIQLRKEQFLNYTNLSLKTNGGQDFRLILPWDAIAPSKSSENYCCLIIEPIPGSISLRDYGEKGAIPALQVRLILKQVLQSLWFLHSQKVRLGNGEIQHPFPHGNINLDSLRLVNVRPTNGFKQSQFQIYLTDLGLWETLFLSPNIKVINPSPNQDLIDLGKVAVSLLTGTPMVEPVVGKFINPEITPQWAAITDEPLKQFIRRLLGLERPPFASAFTARDALLDLPEPQSSDKSELIVTDEPVDQLARPQWLLIGAAVGMLGLLLAFLVWGVRSLRDPESSPSESLASLLPGQPAAICNSQKNSNNDLPLCRLDQVNPLPAQFTYVIESGGSWSYALQKTGLIGENRTLMDELRDRNPALKRYSIPNFVSTESAIAQVKSGQVSFALISQFGQSSVDPDLVAVPVAYDGLGVFVAFSDPTKQGSIPSQLQGKISLRQIQQLYTGKVNSWNAPDALKDWNVSLYLPSEREAINQFETQVLNQQQQAIDEFRRLQIRDSLSVVRITQEEQTYKIFEDILEDFESGKQQLGFGFGLLSMAFGQCAVYPLAMSMQERDVAVQPLIQNNNQPINPTTDLCNDKGGYGWDIEAFKSGRYPLTITLVVLYPKRGDRTQAGQKMAEMLQTEEGQQLLRETGLVPIRKLPK
jgi:hypothetical protein